MQVVDEPRVVMNDGAVGVFDLTLWDEERACNAEARVSYSLRLDMIAIPPTVDSSIRDAVLEDDELRGELKEAVMARRDAVRALN